MAITASSYCLFLYMYYIVVIKYQICPPLLTRYKSMLDTSLNIHATFGMEALCHNWHPDF